MHIRTVDFEASKTAKHLDKDELNGNDTFDARYSTGYIGANGTYVKDLMSWGGLEVKQQIFGLANNSNIDRNILGLSFNTSVGSISRQKPAPYPTFLDNLVDQGTINKRIFSLYLNVSKAETSSLLFGGVDKEKYYDGLVEVPMVPTFIQDVVNQYAIMMDGFVAKGIDGAKELKEKKLVILDNGSPFNLLPAEVIEPLEKHFGTVATNDGHVNGTYVNCDAAKNHDGVNFAFKFAGKTIYLPVEDIILDLYSKSQKRALQRTIGDAAANWNGVCVLAFQREYAGIPLLLGDPFLRNAYVVYDQDRETIALAQAKFNSSKSNIVEVAKNAGVPTKKGDASKYRPNFRFYICQRLTVTQLPSTSSTARPLAIMTRAMTTVMVTRATATRAVVTKETVIKATERMTRARTEKAVLAISVSPWRLSS